MVTAAALTRSVESPHSQHFMRLTLAGSAELITAHTTIHDIMIAATETKPDPPPHVDSSGDEAEENGAAGTEAKKSSAKKKKKKPKSKKVS